MDLAADSAVSAGYGSAGRALHGDLRRWWRWATSPTGCVPKIRERIAQAQGGAGHRRRAPRWARSSRRSTARRCAGYVEKGVAEGAALVVDGRTLKVPGHEHGFFLGPCLFDNVTPGHDDLQGRDLRPGAERRARGDLRRGDGADQREPATPTASPSSPTTAARPAGSRTRCRWAWWASTCRSRCRWPTTPSAAGRARSSATPTSTAREGVHFYTRGKVVTSRWPDPQHRGVNLGLPAEEVGREVQPQRCLHAWDHTQPELDPGVGQCHPISDHRDSPAVGPTIGDATAAAATADCAHAPLTPASARDVSTPPARTSSASVEVAAPHSDLASSRAGPTLPSWNTRASGSDLR